MSVGPSPSGAICAGFESVDVIDGTAYLGVAVKTNASQTAEAKGRGKVGLKAKDVSPTFAGLARLLTRSDK